MKYSTSRLSDDILPILLLFTSTCIVYWVSCSFEFLSTWDDKVYVVTNEAVRGITKANISTAFSSMYVGNYAPLHILSYMVDYTFWGLNPTGYHVTNVVLHAGNGVLFYLWLRMLGLSLWSALAAAWLFVFHPVQVETVAWVSERKNLLAMTFLLGALLSYHRSRQGGQHRLLYYGVSLVLVLAGLLSKSLLVVFPALLILYESSTTTARLFTRRLVLGLIPFVILSVVFTGVTLYSQGGEFGGGRAEFHGGSPAATFFTMIPVLVGYLGDCLIPSNLSPFYMVPIRQYPDGRFWLASLLLTGGGAVAFYYRKQQKMALFGLGIFALFLLPVLQIIPLITLKNDRYLYFPLLGFALCAVVLWERYLSRLSGISRICAQVIVISLLLMLPLLAYRQTLHWRNDITLWNHAVNVDSENRIAWRHLALGYTLRNDPANAFKAISHLEELRQKYGFIPGYDDVTKKLLNR